MRKAIRDSLAVMAAVLGLGQALGQAQNVIDVDIFNTGEVKAIPVHIEGFTGETLALLKFDLFVQGFEFVDKDKAQFTIKGSQNDLSGNWIINGPRWNWATGGVGWFNLVVLRDDISRELYLMGI